MDRKLISRRHFMKSSAAGRPQQERNEPLIGEVLSLNGWNIPAKIRDLDPHITLAAAQEVA